MRVSLLLLLWIPVIGATDLERIPPDLITPAVTEGAPAPGKRVRVVAPEYVGTAVHHALYLPGDWTKEGTYPVIVEYAGNRWRSSPGTIEGSNLGYGISGGTGVIWLCLPFVDTRTQCNAPTWWGDVEATVAYGKNEVRRVCAEFGGDPTRVFIAGFSRGSIACNTIGLHDDEIASLWRGFICHSHYEGVREWDDGRRDHESAAIRLQRLGNRPQFISHETDVEATRAYLRKAFPGGNFTFQALPFPDHTDTWVLRDLPERKTLRDWFQRALTSPAGPSADAGGRREQ